MGVLLVCGFVIPAAGQCFGVFALQDIADDECAFGNEKKRIA
ncbi:hypothetical protein PJE062_2333 [Pseudovibrio sp. JE062]|nr:hypothetical protein PJE062_2333 [Pseudovibrio sp. JE062]